MLSVLLSIYQKEKPQYLQECFDSLLQQTYSPSEIILVEDGPLNDDLYFIIDNYSERLNLKRIKLSMNQGLGKALSEGITHCQNSFIARMDTDDISKPDRFEKQLKIFENYPDIDVVGSWIDEFEGDISNVTSIRKLPETHEDIYTFAKVRNPINHPAVMFKKQAVSNAGGYQHFPLFEDYYLWVRMLMNGSKFYNIQESLLYFRFSPDMFNRRGGWKYAKDEFRFLKTLNKIGFLSKGEYFKNVPIRYFARIIPNNIRTLLYKKILRK